MHFQLLFHEQMTQKMGLKNLNSREFINYSQNKFVANIIAGGSFNKP